MVQGGQAARWSGGHPCDVAAPLEQPPKSQLPLYVTPPPTPRLTSRHLPRTWILPSCGSQNVRVPSSVDDTSCLPSGRKASDNTSCEWGSVSSAPLPLYTSHVLKREMTAMAREGDPIKEVHGNRGSRPVPTRQHEWGSASSAPSPLYTSHVLCFKGSAAARGRASTSAGADVMDVHQYVPHCPHFPHLTVLSQLPDASRPPPSAGLKARHETGPSWPARMSSRRPVLRDHR